MRVLALVALVALGCQDAGNLDNGEASAGAEDLVAPPVPDMARMFPEEDGAGVVHCTKDTDCPGDQVCFDGFCVELPDLALPVGCMFDSDCKGNRVCRGGVCVDPPPLEDLGVPVDLVVRDLVVRDLAELRDLVVVYDMPAYCWGGIGACVQCREFTRRWECAAGKCGWNPNMNSCLLGLNGGGDECDLGLPIPCVCDAGIKCVP